MSSLVINVNIDTNEFHWAENSSQLAGKSRRNFGPNIGGQSEFWVHLIYCIVAATHGAYQTPTDAEILANIKNRETKVLVM